MSTTLGDFQLSPTLSTSLFNVTWCGTENTKGLYSFLLFLCRREVTYWVRKWDLNPRHPDNESGRLTRLPHSAILKVARKEERLEFSFLITDFRRIIYSLLFHYLLGSISCARNIYSPCIGTLTNYYSILTSLLVLRTIQVATPYSFV